MGKKLNRQVVGSLVGCVHCGMCTESCHYVLANPGDPTYAPAYKGDRIRKLFKRKRRKGYRRKQGHRQKFTEIRIDEIVV